MWIKLQLYENDEKSVLGLVVAASGEFFFRATDVLSLMGWSKNPWRKLKAIFPNSRPVRSVLPNNVPTTFGNMRVVAFNEMMDAMASVARTSQSLFFRTKAANVFDYVLRVFGQGRVAENVVVHYSTNPMKAPTVKIVMDTEGTEKLDAFLRRTRERFLGINERFSQTIIPSCEERRLVIDESRSANEREEESSLKEEEFKIICKSPPPSQIVWYHGKDSYIFRCTKFIRQVGNEKMTLYKKTNVLDNQVEERI